MNDDKIQFPEGFLWGAATASYQVEGGIDNNNWALASDPNAGMIGKNPKTPNRVPVAGSSADHYSRYEEDFDIAKELGHTCSRISIEWSRIEPEEGKFNEKEIAHYRSVLKAMQNRELKPFVTLWHFTLPIWFEEKGGFSGRYGKKEAPKVFARYCSYVVESLGDLCQNWATMNEPNVYAKNSFLSGQWPPFRRKIPMYLNVLDNLAKSHIAAYKAVKEINRDFEVSVVKDNINFVSDWKPSNISIQRIVDFHWNHYFLKKLKGNYDAIGLNYYFTKRYGSPLKGANGKPVILEKSDMGWDINAFGIYDVLLDLKRYNVPVYISEAGIADAEDLKRGEYIKGLVRATYSAILAGVDVRAFMYWSLIDNYEWAHGYDQKFGLVSFDWETKERTIRPSALVYKKICEDNGIVSSDI